MSRRADEISGWDELAADEPRPLRCAEDGVLGCDEVAQFASGLCRAHELRAVWALEAAVPEGEDDLPEHAHVWARLAAAEKPAAWDRTPPETARPVRIEPPAKRRTA